MIGATLALYLLSADVPAPAPAPPPHPVLLSAFVGVHQYTSGTNAQLFDAGLRYGALIGWRATGSFSVNLEGLIDRLNPRPPLYRPSPSARELALSPLFHYVRDGVELVVGPRLGYWRLGGEYPGPFRTGTDDGWAVGFNAGLLFQTRLGLSFGALLTYHSRETVRSCGHAPDGSESCITGIHDSVQLLGTSLIVSY